MRVPDPELSTLSTTSEITSRYSTDQHMAPVCVPPRNMETQSSQIEAERLHTTDLPPAGRVSAFMDSMLDSIGTQCSLVHHKRKVLV